MRFEWDPEKRRTNIHKHGIDFKHAAEIFSSDIITIVDDRFDYGEQRFISLGLFRGLVIVVAHTEDAGLVRIISARKAAKYEQRIFFERSNN
jgi:uncharacterized DUF497 family protein